MARLAALRVMVSGYLKGYVRLRFSPPHSLRLVSRYPSANAREEAAKQRENVAQVAALDAAASKAEYETLIRDINALQRRAPK